MATLIHQIANLTAVRYGINILEARPPGEVQGNATTVVGSVAVLPWGPVDTVTLITSPAEFLNLFAPTVFGVDFFATHPAVLAYIGKTFPASMKVVRVKATGSATATKEFDDTGATASVNVSARYEGLQGNAITISFPVNPIIGTNADMRVQIGTYDVTYPNVVTAALVTTDPGDPYVTIVANVAQVGIPLAGLGVLLAGGLDGTAVAGDYLGSNPGGRGLEEYADGSVDVNVIFGAEVPDALVPAFNAGMKTFQDTHKKGICVLSTDGTIVTAATAITDVATYRGDRLVYTWPKVKTVNTYDVNRAPIVVDGNSFAAVAIASVLPEESPGGAPGAPFLKGIADTALTGLLNADALKSLNDAGIAPWFNSTANEGFIIHRGVTTSLVSGLEKIFRRKMTDFIQLSMAASAERYTGTLLDLDLTNKALGPNTSIQMGLFHSFLGDLENPDAPRIRGYTIDAFGANLQSNIDAGQWLLAVAVKLISAQEELVFLTTIGERVELATA